MSGLILPYKNKQAYPAEFEGFSRMAVYGTIFNSIEINSIFYKLPKGDTVSNWAQMVVDPFKFTFKLSKQITHSPNLNFEQSDIKKFFQVIAGAQLMKGCILIQFPGSIKSTMSSEVDFLLSEISSINKARWDLAVEFRHRSWHTEHTYALLNKYNSALVYHDKKGSQTAHPVLNADHIYLRFHGPNGDYKGSYDQGFLFEYAGYISEWLAASKTVYVYFNNTMGSALENMRTLEAAITDYLANT